MGNDYLKNNDETHQVVPRVYEVFVCAGLSMCVTSSPSVPFTAQVNCGPDGRKNSEAPVSSCRISRAAHGKTLGLPLCHQRVSSGGRIAHISPPCCLSHSMVSNSDSSPAVHFISTQPQLTVQFFEKLRFDVSRFYPPPRHPVVKIMFGSVLLRHDVGLQSRFLRSEGLFFFGELLRKIHISWGAIQTYS